MIPKTLGSVASLKARAEKSLAVKEEWRSLLEDTYRYFCPQREVWDFYNAGEDKMNHIFDSTGQVALKEFANIMMSSITPQARIWSIRHHQLDRVFFGQIGGRKSARLAGADDQNAMTGQIAKHLAGHGHAGICHRHRSATD